MKDCLLFTVRLKGVLQSDTNFGQNFTQDTMAADDERIIVAPSTHSACTET